MPKGGRGPPLPSAFTPLQPWGSSTLLLPSSLRFQKQRRRKKEGRCGGEGKKKAGFCWGVRGISCNSTARAKRKTNQPRSKKRAARYIRLLGEFHRVGAERRLVGMLLLPAAGCCVIQMISDTEELDWPSRKRNKFRSFVVLPGGRKEEEYSDCFVALKRWEISMRM